jgi:putative flippase GtrA
VTPDVPAAAAAPPAARRLPPVVGQLLWYTAIGAVMTLAYLGLYAVLRNVLAPQPANVVAWVATAVADTAANRRLTFGITGRSGAVRAQGEGLAVFLLGLAITSGSLALLDRLVAQPGRPLELAVLLGANLGAGLVRFVLLKVWVFSPRRRPRPA